jgi:hypothetical protein
MQCSEERESTACKCEQIMFDCLSVCLCHLDRDRVFFALCAHCKLFSEGVLGLLKLSLHRMFVGFFSKHPSRYCWAAPNLRRKAINHANQPDRGGEGRS